jgi:hypothetical protein
MAVLALYGRVSPKQREAILVILYLLDRNAPSLHGMALSAIRAHLPLVDIGVTVLTLLASVSKHRLDVALRALNFFVHAAQRILRFVVVELRNTADGAPSTGGVAVFAGDLQGAVGASRSVALRLGPC